MVTPFTWRNGAISVLTKWSSCPSTFPRTSPAVSLGADRRSIAAPFLGGKAFDKGDVEMYSDNALEQAVRRLPRDVATLIPPRRYVNVSTLLQDVLEKQGLTEIKSLKQLRRAKASCAPRKLALRSLCGGLGKVPMRAVLSADTVHEAALVCAQMKHFAAPDYIAAWIGRAEVRCGSRRKVAVLKPCGYSKRKRVGVRL